MAWMPALLITSSAKVSRHLFPRPGFSLVSLLYLSGHTPPTKCGSHDIVESDNKSLIKLNLYAK